MTTWSLFDESQSPALFGFEAIVDFGPEGAKISDRGPQGKEHNKVQSAPSGSLEVGISCTKQKQSNGHHLCNHFDFSQFGGRNGESLVGCDKSETVDGDFTADDDADHPCGNQIQLHEGNEYQ